MIQGTKLLCIGCLILLIPAGIATGQQLIPTAKARAVSVPSGRPSTLAIRANILAQKQAALQQQVLDAERCIAESSQPIVLRDPQGNINVVPQTDVVNCTRRLASLQRQLASLARQSDQLAKDADAFALFIQQKQQLLESKGRITGTSP
ncbi:MAG TPA: hypothetical protein VK463_05535 [Desulfomonilaceae bacterium]|nr:hypothetical protein [Desulfomonilaceae bacterium]